MSRKKCTIEQSFFDRLALIMLELGFGKGQHSKFANIIGISATYLSGILKLKKNPSFDMIYGIAHKFPIADIRWLLTGEDAPISKTHETIISAHPRIVSLGDKIASPTEQDLDEYVAVPLVEGKIAAGSGRVVREDIRSFVWVYRPELGKRKNLVAVQIGSDEKSMLPTLAPGSILIIDRNDKIVTKKGIYAVRTGQDECAVKRIHLLDEVVLLCSDNLDYQPFLATTSDLEQLIVGRVIWAWKSLLR